jgi:hypothetical protein
MLVAMALISQAASLNAAVIPVPNGDFENWVAIGDGGVTNTGWASVPSGFTPATNIGRNDEMWASPSNFASGWQSNGTQPNNGKYGLQHPNDGHHVKEAPDNTLVAPFNGHFIGFMNLPRTETVNDVVIENTWMGSVQSGILGNLQEGIYKLTVAFGARRGTHGSGNNPWNDYSGEISLVADPVLGAPAAGGPAHGSMGGTVLGTPASLTIVPALVPSGSTAELALEDLTYSLTVGAGDPNIGKPFAIRIDLENLFTQNGIEGTQAFTQANFDNVRLELIPEPSSMLMVASVAMAMALAARRRKNG